MLTEGWDCNTVTHIVGLRPFMSQLLCEQVVGRGLRRASYELKDDGKFTEEVAQVFGVPFEVIPFKANPQGPAKRREKRYHVHALAEKRSSKSDFLASKATRRPSAIASPSIGPTCRHWYWSRAEFRPKSK